MCTVDSDIQSRARCSKTTLFPTESYNSRQYYETVLDEVKQENSLHNIPFFVLSKNNKSTATWHEYGVDKSGAMVPGANEKKWPSNNVGGFFYCSKSHRHFWHRGNGPLYPEKLRSTWD